MIVLLEASFVAKPRRQRKLRSDTVPEFLHIKSRQYGCINFDTIRCGGGTAVKVDTDYKIGIYTVRINSSLCKSQKRFCLRTAGHANVKISVLFKRFGTVGGNLQIII